MKPEIPLVLSDPGERRIVPRPMNGWGVIRYIAVCFALMLASCAVVIAFLAWRLV